MSKSIFGLILFWLVSLPLRAEQPIFTISSQDANPGQIIDINFNVDNFTDIISVQYSVNWDPTVLKFRAIKNLNANVPGLTPGLFGTTPNLVDNGQFTLSWIESSITPITIVDGSLFFTVEFEVVGSPCDQSSIAITNTPLEIEVAEGEDEISVGLVSNNGEVNVPGVGCSEDIEFVGSQIIGPCGENVCIQFTVQNFNDVGAMGFNLVYDPNVLQFTQFQNYAPLMGFGSGNTNLFAPGELRVIWFNGNIENESLPDGTVLFEICFDVIGTGGQFSNITFGNTPEISDTDGNIYPVNITPARITAQCALEGFALIASPDTVCTQPGEIVCIDIQVNDFEDMIALQFSMNWDSTRFRFDHVEGFGLAGLGEDGFGTPGFPDVKEGQLTMSWIDLSLQGVTVPDFTTIFTLCLEAVGPVNSSSSIIFSGNPLSIEFANEQSVINDYTLVPGVGEIKADCESGGDCTVSFVLNTLNPTCASDSNGVLNLTLMTPNCNCTPTYLWSNGATTQDLTGMPAGDYSVTITCEQIVIATATLTDPPPANITANFAYAGGCTGSIDLTVTGATPPYLFQWSTPPGAQTEDISNLCAGVYTVTITDNNGCAFIGGPYTIGGDAIGNIDHVSCNGVCDGAIDLTATFGNGPYTYLWNTTPAQTTQDLANLCAGIYCVTITENGGGTHDTCFTVTQPNALNATATITHSDNCQGAIDLNVTGGTQPYGYIWQPGGATTQDLIGLCAGQYCVTVTDAHGCTFNQCFTVFAGGFNVALSATQYNGFQTRCNGSCDGRITSTIAGGTPPITYHWSNNASTQNLFDVCAGTYGLTVTDASGQTATASIVLNSPPGLNLNVTETLPSTTGASDGAASVVVTGGVPPYIYQWTGPVNGNTAALNNLPGGVYTILVIDANGCQENDFAQLIVGDGCYKGMPVFTPNSDGKNDHFVITCVADPNHLYIFNRQGALVYETDDYQNNWIGVDLDDEALPDGSYLWVLEGRDDNGNPALYKGVVILLRTAD